MNLTPLFEVQRKLDEKINAEKGLADESYLPEKVLAVQVELGELANEHRGFKFWSEDREAKTEYVCKFCEGSELVSTTTEFGNEEQGFDLYEVDVICPVCDDVNTDKNPLLEEYVDVLHFMLSIGLEEEMEVSNYQWDRKALDIFTSDTIVQQFSLLFHLTSVMIKDNSNYGTAMFVFLALGEMLGFTWDQIEEAYMAKNKINIERQTNGY